MLSTTKSGVAAIAAIMALTSSCSMQESCPNIKPGWRLRILDLATDTVRERENAAGVELQPNAFSSRCCSVSLTPHNGVINYSRNIDTLDYYGQSSLGSDPDATNNYGLLAYSMIAVNRYN